MQPGPVELGDVGGAAELGPVGLGEHAQAVPPHDLDAAPGRRPGAGGSVGSRGPAVGLGQVDDLVELALERRTAGRASRRRARTRAAPWPPSSRCSRRRRRGRPGVRAPAKKTSLNSDVPVICTIGRISMPGGVHADQQERDALVLRRVAVGAGEHEAPVAPVRQRRPHLLAVDHPLVAVDAASGSGLHVGQVASRRRARSSPGTTARSPSRIGGRKRSCCSGVPKWISVGPIGPRRCGRAGRGRRRGRTPRSR